MKKMSFNSVRLRPVSGMSAEKLNDRFDIVRAKEKAANCVRRLVK